MLEFPLRVRGFVRSVERRDGGEQEVCGAVTRRASVPAILPALIFKQNSAQDPNKKAYVLMKLENHYIAIQTPKCNFHFSLVILLSDKSAIILSC